MTNYKKLIPKPNTLEKMEDGSIQETKRIDLFLEEFMKNGGNGTEAAMKTFNCKNRIVAANIASHYLKKARAMSRVYMESKGYTWGKILMMIAKKSEESKTPEFLDRLLKILGYEDFLPSKEKTSNVVNIIQTEKNILDKYMEGVIEPEEVETEKGLIGRK